ncbi:TPA: hypothetical protein ACQ39K_001995 [Yersinia enterocolitica]
MNNIEELKKVALGANLHGWTGFEDALNADGYSEAVSKFIAAANPSVVLALIAQLEGMRVWKKLAAQRYEKLQDLRTKLEAAEARLLVPDGMKLVPVEPTEKMVIDGFESEPDESFSDAAVWEEYEAMSGCAQAAHRAKLCWAAMLAAAPNNPVEGGE